MKNTAYWIMMVFALARAASAQVSVEVVMNQDQYLPGEAIPVRVRLVNNSGQTIHFGDEKWLSYSVESRDGTIVAKTDESPTKSGFDIRPSETITTRASLAPVFSLGDPGRYSLVATVHIKAWNLDTPSATKFFDVVSGAKYWEQEFGVPQSPTNHAEPEIRKYILQQATLMKHMNLYLRVTDLTETRFFRVENLGEMISFSNPQARLDSSNNLHLLYQQGSHVYRYLIIDPDGNLKSRQTYNYTTSAPRFKRDASGNPAIVGGVRRLADNDYPPRPKSRDTNDVPSPMP